LLAPVTEVHYGEEDLLRLNLASAALYPDFVAELEDLTGSSTGYRRSGTLVVARDGDESVALAELLAFQQRLGLEVERVGRRDARRLEPALAPGVRGAIVVKGDHQVDNRALVDALLAACERAGVEFVHARAAGIVGDEKVAGVRTEDATISCGQVVLAALPPVRPVKGQLLHLRAEPRPAPLVSHNLRGLDVYIVPRADGRIVVGATVEEMGFDVDVTAGATLELLRAAWELVPGIAEAELTETVAGLRPGTPDNAPLVGPSSWEGLALATGHYRNGVLLAPLTAQAIAGLVADGAMLPEIAPFSPARFTSRVPA
jgi:glycine oxidase